MKLYSLDVPRIVFARRQKRLSIAAVARGLGVNSSTVSAWEGGRTQIPAYRLAQLLSLYGLEPNDVFTFKLIGGVAHAD